MGLDPGWALEGPRNALSHPAPNGYDLPAGDTVLPQFAALSARGSGDSCLMPGPAPPWGPQRLLAHDAGDLALTPLGDAVSRASVSPSLEGCFRQRDSEPWLFPSSPCSQPQSAQCQRKQLGPPACRERAALPRTGPGLLLLPLRCWTESRLLRHADPLARSLLTKRRRLALGSQLLLATGPTPSTGRWLWATSPVGGKCLRCWGGSGARDALWRHLEQELRGRCIPGTWPWSCLCHGAALVLRGGKIKSPIKGLIMGQHSLPPVLFRLRCRTMLER